MKTQLTSEIEVLNEGLVQGLIRYGERNFWYECDMGSQYLAELKGDPEDFHEISAACLCEALGQTHVEWRNDGEQNACDVIWSDNKALHDLIAGMCLTILLSQDA